MSGPPPLRAEGSLDVGEGQTLFWEESGAPEGVPTARGSGAQ